MLYALQPQLAPPLVPRRWCCEVPERLDHTGAVLTPLDLSALDNVLDDMAEQGIESIAVCFLYSYVNPAIAAGVGYLVLGETLTPVQSLGAVVILAGVLMINWPGRLATWSPGCPRWRTG